MQVQIEQLFNQRTFINSMDFIEKMVEELCWSVISQDTAWTLV